VVADGRNKAAADEQLAEQEVATAGRGRRPLAGGGEPILHAPEQVYRDARCVGVGHDAPGFPRVLNSLRLPSIRLLNSFRTQATELDLMPAVEDVVACVLQVTQYFADAVLGPDLFPARGWNALTFEFAADVSQAQVAVSVGIEDEADYLDLA